MRIGEDLHRESVNCSMKNGVTLNEFCRAATAEKINATKSAWIEIKSPARAQSAT